MNITREMHDRLNAKFQEIKAANPGIVMRPTQAESMAFTKAQTETWKNLMALSAVASSFASGFSAGSADRKRALKLISE